MAELKRYTTTINGLETQLQLTEEEAEKRGLTGGTKAPEVSHSRPHVVTDGVQEKEAGAPANKGRTTAKKTDV